LKHPPGHLVESYDPKTNFITPLLWNLTRCSGYSCRPKLVVVKNCKGVVFSGAKFLNSPLWTTTLVQSFDILVENMTIMGDRRWPNNDGLDPVDSSDIIVRNTRIATGDDAICLITHTDLGITNVTVENCEVSSSSSGLKISAYESKASGVIANITFRNVAVTDTNRGLAVCPRWGSGSISNILFEDITIETHFFSTPWWGSSEPIYITLVNDTEYQLWTGELHDITFRNISILSEAGIVIFANGTPITDITLDRIDIMIGQWYSNYTNPVHDWRPSEGPDYFYAPINGFYVDGIDTGVMDDISINFMGKEEPYWGGCFNMTRVSKDFKIYNTYCNRN